MSFTPLWSPTAFYNFGDTVQFQGQIYYLIVAGVNYTIGTAPGGGSPWATTAPPARITIGYNVVFTWKHTTPPPGLNGIFVADVSHLIPYFTPAVPPPQQPTIEVSAGTVLCGYNLAQEDSATPDPFPASGTFFLYLSADGSTLQDAGTIILTTLPFSSVAELINDLDNVTPTEFFPSVFGSIPTSLTSLRLMAYYSPPTEMAWSVKFALGIFGVSPISAILTLPPP